MIRDRGAKKWVSLMLPEHVKLLREWVEEDEYEGKKELDEQYLERIGEMITVAEKEGKPLAITYYKNRRYETMEGVIEKIDSLKGEISLLTKEGKAQSISFASIVDVQLVDE